MKKIAEFITQLFVRNKKPLIVLLIIVLFFSGIQVISCIIPHPLGNGFTYLGQKVYQINFWQTQSVYYYGTNMTVKEVEKYFENVTPSQPNEKIGDFTEIWLSNDQVLLSAHLYYYDSASIHNYHTEKKHVVALRSEEYESLKSSIRK